MGVITLLTDFGHRDSYVGVMKGVIASISPQSQIIDLTHGLQPQAILAARFNLITSYLYFPVGTIHVVVVDPGVGTQRAAIAAEVSLPAGLQTIIAPNNGILTGFAIKTVTALTNPDYWFNSEPSNTFHGRDIFAPAAAHLANGIPIGELGTSLPVSSLVSLSIKHAVVTDQGYRGSIQYIDHFGNLVTTILGDELTSQLWYVQLGARSFPYCPTYGGIELGEALALIGSHGYVEIAVNGDNAHRAFQAKVGDAVELIYARHGSDTVVL